MQKHFLSLLALVLCATLVWADKPVTAPADIPAYYTSLNNKSSANLWTALSSVAALNRGNLGYDGLYDAYVKTDSYPADSVGKAGKVWDMYSNCNYVHNQKKCGNYSNECDCYNREHSIPKSWFGGSTSGIGCDIFHVVPTDGKVNGMRSAFVYGEVASATYTSHSGHKKGSGKAINNDKQTICAAAGSTTACPASTVFEPIDEYKGDFARGYMGTMASWNRDMTQAEGSNFFKSSYTVSTNFGLTPYGVALLMKWHRQDPVSQKEIDRNNGIQATQGNRNPFIDYPYLAEYVWGEKAGETVDMSKLIASCEAGFIPGRSSGWRDEDVPPTPPTPTVKYGVTWSVNGEPAQVDSVAENQKPTMPAEPVSCSTESDVFMGWTTAAIEGTQDEVPAVLYTQAADFPAVTADVTYYAVFAQTEQGASTPATYTYDTDHKEGWINSGGSKNGYWLLDSGKELISPEIDLSGLASIQARLRTFGGTQYDQFAFAAGSTNIGTITVTGGSTMTDYTWTNTKSLTGRSTITFTCSNAGSDKGVGFSSVVINATGAGVTYTRYITTCQETTEVELVSDETPARKILVGGQIYLQVGEQLFNLQGQRVK